MKISEYLRNNLVYLDGGMGTLLQDKGLRAGELPERWNLTHPEEIIAIHKAYFDAGSNVVCTNTFGANLLKYGEGELREIISSAIRNVEIARETSIGGQEKFIALDIGPLGRLLKPYGDLDFEKAVEIYAKTVKIAVEFGVDLILIETMNDSYDTKAALLAAKENSELPVFVSNAYGEDGKLMTGATPAAMVALLEGMGADAIGVNCSFGPTKLGKIIEEYLKYSSLPVLFKPNAGLPKVVNGRAVFDTLPDKFSLTMEEYVRKGVRLVGGCCGTTPLYIDAITKRTKGFSVSPIEEKDFSCVSSYTHAIKFSSSPILIGERINPTGKKAFKEALRQGNIGYILDVGLSEQEKGVHILDVNVGLPEINEAEMLKRVCFELQAIIDLPLQIDTSDYSAMEIALRNYNGKAMINSVSGKEESMRRIFPLVKKYGGVVVCLTLDEGGIPEKAEGRVAIARRIISVAEEYGIKRKDLIFDTLAMTVSSDSNAALSTLSALKTIKNDLGCHTLLGVSNVSFGLPRREIITATFFAIALENGLSAAIMNPNSPEMMKTYFSFGALHGLDKNCGEYIKNIEKYDVISEKTSVEMPKPQGKNSDFEELSPLKRAIVKGLKEQAATLTASILEKVSPLEIVNEQIIPALDIVGQGFENNSLYLPQLLMSAEAAQSAFESIKKKLSSIGERSESRGKFVLATVHGDVHDIGKNIVRLLLENYGFEVIDLGKDVPPEKVVGTVLSSKAPLVGLSALMTTTVPAMERTIKLLKNAAPHVKIAVGGAVLTAEYAQKIGADFYGKDAMATVRYALKMTEA